MDMFTPTAGTTLPNGATVIEARESYKGRSGAVLAVWVKNGRGEYAVWTWYASLNQAAAERGETVVDVHCENGAFTEDLDTALEQYTVRLDRVGALQRA